jgi:hypothetical protein
MELLLENPTYGMPPHMMSNIIFNKDPEEMVHTNVLDESMDDLKMKKIPMFPKFSLYWYLYQSRKDSHASYETSSFSTNESTKR